MNALLKDKRIVIIGGSSGIGLSASRAFVNHGASVVASGLSIENVSDTERCHFIAGDACESGHAGMVIEDCEKRYGGFDGLFHVAGGSGRKWGDGVLHDMDDVAWDKTLELNLTSVMWSNKAAVQYFAKHSQGGTILNLSTLLAYRPSPKFFHTHAYAAAKAGIIGFSKSIASYYAPQNIRVNVIAPGLVDTPMAERAKSRDDIMHFIKSKQPLDGGRMGRPSDIDGAACYFMSDHSVFTTGQVLGVDGGWALSEGQFE